MSNIMSKPVRRTAVLMAFVTAVFAFSPRGAIADDDPYAVGEVNLTQAQYLAAGKRLQGRGYRPAHWNAYRSKGQTLYTALWLREEIPWKERLNRTLAEYQEDAKSLQGEEYRPVSLIVTMTGGQPRFSTLWKKLDGETYYFHDQTPLEQFRKFSAQYAQQSVYPASLTVVEHRGQALFNGIWESARPESVEYELALREPEFRRKTGELERRGFALKFMTGYEVRTKLQFAGIWEKQPGKVVKSQWGMTQAEWETQSSAFKQGGFEVQSVQGYSVSGQPRFAAVWTKLADAKSESK